MSYFTLGHRLPHFLSAPLFGDRQKFGLEIQHNDEDWIKWEDFYLNFYQNTQKMGAGKKVNDAGYRILRKINLQNKRVLEFGPGILPHCDFWIGKPGHYTIIDNQQELLDQSSQILNEMNIPVESFLVDSHMLPVPDHQEDIVIAFYSLEHLYPLELFLSEMKRVLKPGGFFIGGIPTEGGLAWGLGRFFTSRRYTKRNSTINPDKIICWEHPNFADHILSTLDQQFLPQQKVFWPFRLPSIDMNLIVSYIYQSRED